VWVSSLRQDRLDLERRIDHDRLPCLLAADEVGGAAEIVVQDLGEEHGARRYQ
jgi:hypothetical protein